jgi:hypothetical protein
LNLTSVDQRKEVVPDQHQHGAAETKHEDRNDRDDPPPAQERRKQPGIGFAQPLETAFEAGMDSGE